MSIEKNAAQLLFKKRKTLAVAESCTGGLLSDCLTNIPGSSRYFKLGLITYSYESKESLLKIPHKLLLKFGAVSAPVTSLMAQNVRKLLNTDFGIGITGIAGPSGATKTKPLGLTYISLSSKSYNICLQYIFKGSRTSIKQQAAHKALQLLMTNISSR